MSDVAELLGDVGLALGQLEMRWYLFGAQAVLIYGRPRLTEDVDVTVELGAHSMAELVAALEQRGFELPDFADDAFVSATRVLPMVHRPTGLSLDVVLAGPGLESMFLSRARLHDIGDSEVPVITPEDLVVTKILGARPKDLDDVHGILAEQRELDVDAVRELLTALELALGQSDLLETFARLIQRRR